jgi:hypothetical protein
MGTSLWLQLTHRSRRPRGRKRRTAVGEGGSEVFVSVANGWWDGGALEEKCGTGGAGCRMEKTEGRFRHAEERINALIALSMSLFPKRGF